MHLPTGYLVGAPRSATTSVSRYLDAHPDITTSRPKEPMFHAHDLPDPRAIRDRAEYATVFDRRPDVTHRIDASPWYLYSTEAAASIAEMTPEAKLIIQLRDPVDYIVSLYRHLNYLGLEPERDMETAVFAERSHVGDFRIRVDYLEAARFGAQVSRYLDRFRRDQIHVVRFDSIVEDPRTAHLGILRFLGVAGRPLAEYDHFNPTRAYRNAHIRRLVDRFDDRSSRIRHSLAIRARRMNTIPYPVQTTPAFRDKVLGHIADDIARLPGLVGLDVTEWLDPDLV